LYTIIYAGENTLSSILTNTNKRMKNTLGLLIGLLILGGVAYYLMQSNTETKSTLNSTGAKFAINKDDVHRILITRKSNNNLDFTRVEDGWKVNEFYANPNTMSTLLNTMAKIDMIFIPYKSYYEVIMSDLEKIGIHVEAFDKSGKKITGYTIGSNTLKNDASYFILDGDTQPYAMNIKGFDGTIRDRYNYNIENWKDKTIFNESASNISKVKVTYPKKLSSSFEMIIDDENYEVKPTDPLRKPISKPINESKVLA